MKLDDDDFTLFGLPARFALDRAALDQRWRELQAEVHPDRFASQGTAAQRVAMQWAVRVNEAHQRLKHPLKRAAYLCELRGQPVDAERNTAMPPAFLVQQMNWREALEDARGEADVLALQDDVQSHEATLYADLADALDRRGDAAAASAIVRSLMFVSRFQDDLERRLEALAS